MTRASKLNLYLVVLLTVLLHLAFAGSRVTLSLFANSLNASPFTVGLILGPSDPRSSWCA